MRTCPTCTSEEVYRSRRRWYEHVITLARPGLRPFRCHRCNHRFWDNRHGHSRFPSSPQLVRPAPPAPRSRPRRNRSREPSVARLGRWLYRKHSLTIGSALLLIFLGLLILIGTWWALGQLERF
ncbi:MAG: hypothetical protein HY710_08940 [Candidatus Latescibacteria bacterium]|nr:hypothetical protein [Candidatus Latescibacterota bacterium]